MGAASLKEYQALLEERPRKFTAAEVQFGIDPKHPCAGCLHYYIGVQAEAHVCEIYRPEKKKIEDEDVPPEGSCRFWTVDGTTFPKLEKD